MFDFGFSELMFIALVALIVVGPKRLPKVARTAGHLLGRMQRYVADVKSDISREMQLEDLKSLQQQVEQQARDLESSVRSEMNKVERDLKHTAAEVEKSVQVEDRSLPPSAVKPPMPDTMAEAAAPAPTSAPSPSPEESQLQLGLDAVDDKQGVNKS